MLRTQQDFAAYVTRRGQYPITTPAQLIALSGKSENETVNYLGHKISLASLSSLPASFFPVENEAAMVDRMNDSATYLTAIRVIEPVRVDPIERGPIERAPIERPEV
jgi:hypothetical protein